MVEAILSPTSNQTSSELADWIELLVLLEHRSVLTPGSARELLHGVGDDVDEADVGLAFALMRRRSRRGLMHYPFETSGSGLHLPARAECSLYSLLLVLASAGTGVVVLKEQLEGAKQFERVVAQLMSNFFGSDTISVRFGTPRDPQRPAHFPDAIAWIAQKMHTTLLPLPPSAATMNDGGADVLVWRAFGDSRSSTVLGLVQCTFDSDLRKKAAEIAGAEFHRWLDATRTVPVIATPADVDETLWRDLSYRAIVLDRWRLLSLAAGAVLDPATADEAFSWTESELERWTA